jgi:hypothetical protein
VTALPNESASTLPVGETVFYSGPHKCGKQPDWVVNVNRSAQLDPKIGLLAAIQSKTIPKRCNTLLPHYLRVITGAHRVTTNGGCDPIDE